MDILGQEFLNLINTFEKNQLKYLIVGGFATYYHGYQRTTGDIDFWVEDSFQNRANLVTSLEEMGYGRFEALMTAPFIAGYCEVMLDNGIYADIMNSIIGFEEKNFQECYARAEVTLIDNVKVRFIHLNDLIHSKEVSTRPKDLNDAVELKKIHSIG